MLRFTILSIAFFASLASAFAQTPIPSDSRLKSIIDNKIVRIAYRTDATPFSFKSEKGEPAGFSQIVSISDPIHRAAVRSVGHQDRVGPGYSADAFLNNLQRPS